MSGTEIPDFSQLACPSCGAQPGEKCRTVVDGVDTGWDHDTRIYRAMFTDPHPEAGRMAAGDRKDTP